MRIIGGKYRGKKLISPSSENVRPTSDKAREALFNILRSRLSGGFAQLKLVDIFAGSGAFALEALSQGFAKVAMVDIDTKDLLKNVALFDNEKNNIKIVKCDVNRLSEMTEQYDVLFMDAPYNKGLSEVALEKIATSLKKGALCIIELEKNEICNLPNSYRLLDERRYGIAKFLIAEVI